MVKEGADWKILKIDSPDLVLTNKFGEKVEIMKGVFIQPIKIIDYKDKKPANLSNKFVLLNVGYENELDEIINFSTVIEWRIFNQSGEFYYPIINIDWQTVNQNNPPQSTSKSEITWLPDIKLNPRSSQKTNIFFEIPKDFIIEELIFQNYSKKVIFKFD